jgi:phosphoglycerol transferase MdoB-like AlkP superfamily enzyme
LLLIAGAALTSFTLTRLGLVVYSLSEADVSILELLRLLGVGLLYDLAFCLYAALPLALWTAMAPAWLWRWRPHRIGLYLVTISAMFALGVMALGEVLFWDEFGVRFNFIAVDYLVYTPEVLQNIRESYPVAGLLAGVGVLASVLVWALLMGLAGAAYLFLGQSLRDVSGNQYQDELASNGPYQLVAAFRNNELDYDQFYATIPEDRADRLLRAAVAESNARFETSDVLDIRRRIENPARQRRLNLMLVMVESLSASFMGRYGDSDGRTPYLDALADQSLVFDRFYATGTRTTRGLEAVTLSIPPTPGRSIVKRLGRETGLTSLGNVLRDEGYDTRFIYGGRGYFDNMNEFFRGNGYDIVDQASTAAENVTFSNAWGMSDEDLFAQASRAADEAAQAGRPFFFHIMTTSNHRPFTYPEGRIDIPSGSGRAGAVKYTDWAIGEFLEGVRQRPWFEDTVFVFVADHCASSAGRVDLPLPLYHIPCIVYSPGWVEPAAVQTVASQIDLAPTLLGLLGVSYDSTFVGRDILATQPRSQRALIGNYQHLGLYESGMLTILSPRKKVAQREAESPEAELEPKIENERLVAECIAYYEGAGYIYKHGLNAWRPKSRPAQ